MTSRQARFSMLRWQNCHMQRNIMKLCTDLSGVTRACMVRAFGQVAGVFTLLYNLSVPAPRSAQEAWLAGRAVRS